MYAEFVFIQKDNTLLIKGQINWHKYYKYDNRNFMIPQELLYMRHPVSFQARFGKTLGHLSAKRNI